MILIACVECSLAIRVIGNVYETERLVGRESDFWPSSFPCPRCGKNAQGLLEKEAEPVALRSMELIDLTPQEAFIAFQGMGLPAERDCKQAQVEELFRTPIRKIAGYETKTSRYVLEHIEFWDGTKMYFGSSPQGAVVYKISPPPNYAKRELHG